METFIFLIFTVFLAVVMSVVSPGEKNKADDSRSATTNSIRMTNSAPRPAMISCSNCAFYQMEYFDDHEILICGNLGSKKFERSPVSTFSCDRHAPRGA